MAEQSYHHRRRRKRRAGWLWFWISLIVLILLFVGVFAWDVYRSQSQQQTGEVILSEFEIIETPKRIVDELTYTMKLPSDWEEVGRFDATNQKGVRWQSTKAKFDNRYLTVYVDVIPLSKPVNKLLPIESIGSKLRHGEISDNCAKYTPGGLVDANSALKSKPIIAKWEEVEFLCDLPKVFDNVVGTSSKDGINRVSVKGQNKGLHTYFFEYTDHNIHPDYEIFIDIIESFEAK